MAKRLTKEQKAAWQTLYRTECSLDRYLGSVFVTPLGKADHQAQVAKAMAECVRLGLDVGPASVSVEG